MISFYQGKTKVRIITEERLTTPHNTMPLYAEGVHMLDGIADKKVDDFLEDHPTIIRLFEIDTVSAVSIVGEWRRPPVRKRSLNVLLLGRTCVCKM